MRYFWNRKTKVFLIHNDSTMNGVNNVLYRIKDLQEAIEISNKSFSGLNWNEFYKLQHTPELKKFQDSVLLWREKIDKLNATGKIINYNKSFDRAEEKAKKEEEEKKKWADMKANAKTDEEIAEFDKKMRLKNAYWLHKKNYKEIKSDVKGLRYFYDKKREIFIVHVDNVVAKFPDFVEVKNVDDAVIKANKILKTVDWENINLPASRESKAYEVYGNLLNSLNRPSESLANRPKRNVQRKGQNVQRNTKKARGLSDANVQRVSKKSLASAKKVLTSKKLSFTDKLRQLIKY
jgi:hypothetical protein